MDTRTAIIYGVMKSRVKEIEQNAQRTEPVQQQQLRRVLRQLNRTQYRSLFSSTPIQNYEQYARLIPVTEYEAIRPWAEEMLKGKPNQLTAAPCRWFATSSGTSGGRSKYLPVPSTHLHASHFKGASDALWLYLSTRSDSRFFSHKSLVIGGSHKPTTLGSGTHTGDLSAILVEHMPALGRMFRVPSTQTLLMDEWVSKMAAIVKEVAKADVGSLSGVPSWMLETLLAILDHEGKSSVSEVWPNLEVFFHGGISFDPYRERYKELIPSPRMQYRETYNASEGFFAIQSDPADSAMLLMNDYGIFYEFIPVEEVREGKLSNAVPLWGVEKERTYAMIISTLGGLYRYIIGDTVRFTSLNPYKIVIAGRTQNYINAFGEELMEHNANNALATVCARYGCSVRDYTVAPYFLLDEAKGYHRWLIEFNSAPQDIEAFAQSLDAELRSINSDYDAKRYADMALEPLHLTVAPTGLFTQWLSSKGKLGGQNKVPRMKNDNSLMEELLALMPKP